MFSPATRRAFSILLVVTIALTIAVAQTRSPRQKPANTAPPKPEQTPAEPQEIDKLTTDTDLVTVPVIASDRNGVYITDLKKEDFAITEDGTQQQIAFFGKVAAPFHVVLVLDVSSSARDKLKQIRDAANAFVDQLQPADRVKVIAFSDDVKDLNEFTNNRDTLRRAINGTISGNDSKVYDAVALALNTMKPIRGRKAIVMFSDGMDWHSDSATFDDTLRWLDEEGTVVYPIRYDTRATTEQLAREQASQVTPELPTIDVIRKPPSSGTTAPTFPGGDEIPTSGTTKKTGPWGLPSGSEILRRRREEERSRVPPSDDPGRQPDVVNTRDRRPPTLPGEERGPTTTTDGRDTRSDDSINRMLNLAYLKADKYLDALAERSGGRLLRADTIASLPAAFSQIAAELRTQYMLGYYPVNKERDERYRTIKVTTARKNVVIRARPGYLSTNAR